MSACLGASMAEQSTCIVMAAVSHVKSLPLHTADVDSSNPLDSLPLSKFILPGLSRRRFIFESWPRDPSGPILEKPGPFGKRPPNNLIWASDLDSFYWTERIPRLPIVTVWTRSMIQEFGENHYNIMQINEEEPDPKLIPPWPLMVKTIEEFRRPDDKSGDDYVESNDRKTFSRIPSSAFTFEMSVPDALAHDIKWLPKLEEFIPDEYFPDILMVHDPDDLTPGKSKSPDAHAVTHRDGPVVEYKRLWPVFDRDKLGSISASDRSTSTVASKHIAHLHLAAQCRMGMGHHSLVYRAALTLPPPLSTTSSTGQATVAAKIAVPRHEAHDMLKQEAYIYNKFPKHLMEDWSGFHLVSPHKFPVPADAVVPKFYGYYVPVYPQTEKCRCGLSPILLIEECGEPIEIDQLSMDERSACYTHILRLHYEQFMQNSIYLRNIVVQPGPLCRPPSERSIKCPSFRIIDFGRGLHLDDWLGPNLDKSQLSYMLSAKMRDWNRIKDFQEADARRELAILDAEP